MDKLQVQVGGDHYKKYPIQPILYAYKNNLGPCEANIVKYATRWKDKGGIQDLEKIIHYAQLLIQLAKDNEPNVEVSPSRPLFDGITVTF